MAKLKLIEPTIEYEKQIWEYRAEFDEGEKIEGAPQLDKANNVEEWLLYIKQFESWETLKDGQVPSKEFLVIKENDSSKKIICILNIRLALNDYFFNFGGHIGGSVRPSLQNKRYGVFALKLGLEKASSLGLKRVLLTCEENNLASEKLFKYFGGVYEDTREYNNEIKIKRFWIDLENM